MRARLAKKLLQQLLSKQVEVLRVPPGGALVISGYDPRCKVSARRMEQFIGYVARETKMPVVGLPFGIEIKALAASEILDTDIAKAQEIARKDESAGLNPSHITLAQSFGCSAADLQGGDKSHLWDAYRVAFKAQRDARWEPRTNVTS